MCKRVHHNLAWRQGQDHYPRYFFRTQKKPKLHRLESDDNVAKLLQTKKFRKLKKLVKNEKDNSESNKIVDNENSSGREKNDIDTDVRLCEAMLNSEEIVNVSENDSIHSNSINDSNINSSHENDSNSAVLCNEEVNSVSDIKSKIQQWTLDNLDTLQLNVVTDLLRILREEGHLSLPTTAQSLLGTKHHRILQQMKSNKNTQGEYIYIGIEPGLHQVINTQIFIEEEICILVHIDGVQIYNNSQIQVWPIIMKIFNKEYNCEPCTVALYCGDSKPASTHDYLIDFVTEANKLINQGVTLNTRTYSFKIIGIIADSPARSFVKCIKPPGAFYACERCSVKGISVGKKLKKKRIYPEINCSKRTHTQRSLLKTEINHSTIKKMLYLHC